MAGPLAGISAGQLAQQKPPDQQQLKQGPSKFDQALNKAKPEQAGQVGQAGQVHQAQQVGQVAQVQHAQKVDQINKIDQARLGKVQAGQTSATGERTPSGKMDPVTQKSGVNEANNSINGLFSNIEKGQVQMDKLINGGLSGKNFSNSELLALQAGMYKYSQELELTSKVVEKATSGLKDTLKTQV